MGSNTNIGIALVLSAQNQASATINQFLDNTQKKLQAFSEGMGQIGKGMSEIFAASKGMDFLKKTTDAFGDMENAGNYLKATLLDKNGLLDEKMYNKLFEYSKQLSATYTGSTESYLQMIRVLKQNRIEPKDIVGGIGEAVAKLSIYFDNMAPDATAEFAAHMKNDMGVAANEIGKVTDLVARLHDMGLGKTGSEAVAELNQFYSKVGLGMANLHNTGIEEAKKVGILGAIFMNRGISGQSVGTNMRRIFDGLASGGKLEKANAEAAKFGRHLEFFDKNHKFKGIDNFVLQLGKLHGLSPAAIEAILNPFSGKQGLSTDFLQFLTNEGVGDYKKLTNKADNQADLNKKNAVVMSGQKMQEAVLASNKKNMIANFGAAITAPYKQLLALLNRVTVALGNFFANNPKLMKVAAGFIAITSAALAMQGVITMIKGITTVMKVMNLTMALNPVVLVLAAIAAAAWIVYTYWDEISAFFKAIWSGIVGVFKWAWHSIGTIVKIGIKIASGALMLFNPVELIMSNWKPLTSFFTDLWAKIKVIFSKAVQFLFNFGQPFQNAGKNIVTSIAKGILSVATLPVRLMLDIVKKIRAYLPFSPAKEGPLRDIHRIRLIETIATSIKPNALIHAWQNTLQSLRGAMNSTGGGGNAVMPVAGGMGGFHVKIEVNMQGGGSAADGKAIGDQVSAAMNRWWREHLYNKQRVSFT